MSKTEAFLCFKQRGLVLRRSSCVQMKGPACCTVSRKSEEGMMDATGGLEALYTVEHAGGPSREQLGTFGFTSLPVLHPLLIL